MRKLTYLIPFLAFFIVFQSCEKSDLPNEFNSIVDEDFKDLQFQSENFGNPTTGSFLGVITDENRNTIEGVQIRIGNIFTTTDRNGVFIMNDVDVFENFAYIKAEKAGYMPGFRVVIPKPNGVNRVEIQLFKKESVATIMSGETSTVTLQSGVEIQFEGSFISDIDGSPYNGPVDVVAHYIPPNRLSTFTQMPGSLFAQTESNIARSLETYGMVSVNLFSASDQPLNIDPNTTATIKFPVDISQTDTAPESIPLWSFDEEVGYWKEEGEATKQGNSFVGEVNHFSWWNVDLPIDLVRLCFTVRPENIPSSGQYRVLIQRTVNDQFLYFGYVNAGEMECGFVPKDETLRVRVPGAGGSCATLVVYDEVVGGFSSNTSIDLSFQEQTMTTQITGTVTNCNGDPVTNGYLYLDGSNISSITNGIIDASMQHCANQSVLMQIYDFDTNQWYAEDIVLNGSSVDIGSLSTCGDSGGIFNGNINFYTQEQVNSFGLFNYSRVNGAIYIGSIAGIPSTVTDLSPLSSIEQVSSIFRIERNSELENLNGLENLRIANSIRIVGNEALTSVAALGNIESLNSFIFNDNNAATSLAGLESWDFELANLFITRNSNLVNIESVSGVTLTNDIFLENIPTLTSLENFNFANSIRYLQLRDNTALTSLAGLENVTSIDFLLIGGNDALTSLDGIENLLNNRAFYIGVVIDTDIFASIGNASLTDLCAAQNLFNNGTFIETSSSPFQGVRIENNGFNPTIQDIQNGNCSM